MLPWIQQSSQDGVADGAGSSGVHLESKVFKRQANVAGGASGGEVRRRRRHGRSQSPTRFSEEKLEGKIEAMGAHLGRAIDRIEDAGSASIAASTSDASSVHRQQRKPRAYGRSLEFCALGQLREKGEE